MQLAKLDPVNAICVAILLGLVLPAYSRTDRFDLRKPVSVEERATTLERYGKAAEQGDADAQLRLGKMYQREKDCNAARPWYEKAAQQGSAEAQFRYSQCISGTRHFEELKKAADLGYPEAQYEYAGAGVRWQKHTRSEMFQWLLKAAEGGVTEAQYFVVKEYLSKDDWHHKAYGVTYNPAKAFPWLVKLAEEDTDERGRRTYAQQQLGWMYYRGEGTTQDYAKAFYWFSEAAKKGGYEAYGAYLGLSTMYRNGHYVERDVKKADEWDSKRKPVPIQH